MRQDLEARLDRALKERPLSAAQRNVLAKASDPNGFECSGFDGEHVTARSLAKRGLVSLTKIDGGMWRVVRVRP